MKNYVFLTILCCLLGFYSCNKMDTGNIVADDGNSSNIVADDGNSSLWVALYDGEFNDKNYADKSCYVYRDGKLYYTFPIVSKFIRQGLDIYALVRTEESSIWNYSIWKNGERLYNLDSGRAYPVGSAGAEDIFILNDDIYSCGTQIFYGSDGKKNSVKGKVWKNKEVLFELECVQNHIWPSSIYVEGTDVYVVGRIIDDEDKSRCYPVVWKNGKLVFQGQSGKWAHLFDVKFYFGDIYFAGSLNDDDDGGGPHARIWRNYDVLYDLTTSRIEHWPEWADVYGFAIKGNDVYSVGEKLGGGVVWKNDQIMWYDTGGYGGYQHSIAIIGDDIYTAGVVDGLAQIWKNGEVYQTFNNPQTAGLITDGSISTGGWY